MFRNCISCWNSCLQKCINSFARNQFSWHKFLQFCFSALTLKGIHITNELFPQNIFRINFLMEPSLTLVHPTCKFLENCISKIRITNHLISANLIGDEFQFPLLSCSQCSKAFTVSRIQLKWKNLNCLSHANFDWKSSESCVQCFLKWDVRISFLKY